MRFRKRPVEVDAWQWCGDNADELAVFAGPNFAVLDDEDRANCNDPEATAQIFDRLHATWVLVYTRDWIVRGIRGEYYPIKDDVLWDTYEAAEAA